MAGRPKRRAARRALMNAGKAEEGYYLHIEGDPWGPSIEYDVPKSALPGIAQALYRHLGTRYMSRSGAESRRMAESWAAQGFPGASFITFTSTSDDLVEAGRPMLTPSRSPHGWKT